MLQVQQNVLSEIQALAEQVISLKNRMSVAVAMYTAEGVNVLSDADIQALTEFAHVTQAEMTAAKNALDSINTAIGEYTAGTNATKLMRVVHIVPR